MEQPEQPEHKWVSDEEEKESVGLYARRSRPEHDHAKNGDSLSSVTITDVAQSGHDDTPVEFKNSDIVYSEREQGVSEIKTSSGVDVEEGCEQEVEDLDVEGVLEKQETHDLFCPKCHSCITKRVILRRRKPKIGTGSRRRRGTTQLSAIAKQSTTDLVHVADGNDGPTIVNNQETDTDVFRCLSCFSFFIPAGNGFFTIFGAKNKETTPIEHGAIVSEPERSAEDVILGSREGTSLQPESRIDIAEDTTEVPGWEILKSIVYGGLLESITSLGVVSSAAGAGGATLNIMVLGLANLIGGLFAIAHSLRELRNDPSRGGTNETEDRYRALLGRREHFKLHAVLVILSYLIFGALPPVIYGFSFRGSDDRDLKLAVVAASSLVCITLLAIGKVRVEKPPKSYFKTVLYYITVGFMASGVSYVVGDLLEKLLEDLGLFETSLAITNARFHDHEQGWASN